MNDILQIAIDDAIIGDHTPIVSRSEPAKHGIEDGDAWIDLGVRRQAYGGQDELWHRLNAGKTIGGQLATGRDDIPRRGIHFATP